MDNPWELFLASFEVVREAPAPEVPPKDDSVAVAQTNPKGRRKAAPKAPAKQ